MSMEDAFNAARRRVLSGEQLTIAEQNELLQAIRSGRYSAAEAGAASRTKKSAAKKTLSDDDLGSQLDDLGL